MAKKIINLILILFYFVQSSAFASEALNEIEEVTINSKVLGENRKLVVYLPAGYEIGNKRFPVLYITDGDIQGPHTKGTLDFLAKNLNKPPIII